MFDYPIYYKDEATKHRSNPEELKTIVPRHYPLTKEFIDWVVEQGFKISYFPDWREGVGAVWWGLRRIALSPKGEQGLIDKVLVHELIHIAIPGVPGSLARLREKERCEEVIDAIADIYLDDPELMEYIKKTIPVVN
jgi:hypothetical protein